MAKEFEGGKLIGAGVIDPETILGRLADEVSPFPKLP